VSYILYYQLRSLFWLPISVIIAERSPSPSHLYQIAQTPPPSPSTNIQPDNILHGVFNIPDSPTPSFPTNAPNLPIPPLDLFTISDTPNASPSTIPVELPAIISPPDLLFQVPDSPDLRDDAMDVSPPSFLPPVVTPNHEGGTNPNAPPSTTSVELPASISPPDLLFQVPDSPDLRDDAMDVSTPSMPNRGGGTNFRLERPGFLANGDALIPYLPVILSRAALLRAHLAEIYQHRMFTKRRIDDILCDIAEVDRRIAGLRVLQILRHRKYI
jgi:hypothetical protein